MAGPLILTVTPRGKPGIYVGKIEGTGLSVRATRHPLVDTARALLLVGASPDTVIKMRDFGSNIDRVSGRIGTILQRTSRKGAKAAVQPILEAKRGPRGRFSVRNFDEVDDG